MIPTTHRTGHHHHHPLQSQYSIGTPVSTHTTALSTTLPTLLLRLCATYFSPFLRMASQGRYSPEASGRCVDVNKHNATASIFACEGAWGRISIPAAAVGCTPALSS